jgi:hypothetical protein
MTTVSPEPLTAQKARELTDRINELISQTENLVAELLAAVDEAKAGAAWYVLGYKSWTHYVREEFGQTGRIRCGPYGCDERQALVAALSERGMPTRAIAAVVGVSHVTVARDLAAVTDVTAGRTVTGGDGKTYAVPDRPLPRTDEELLTEHLGLDRERERPTTGGPPTGILAVLARIRTDLREVAEAAQDVTIDWTDWRTAVAEEVHGISRMADMVAGIVESGSASFEDGLRQLLDGDGGPDAT